VIEKFQEQERGFVGLLPIVRYKTLS
jgi:hypothetical protein